MDTQGLKLIDGKGKDLVQFIMFVIVSLMDNSNVLEMRKFPVFWFCLHSTMGGWEAGQGGVGLGNQSTNPASAADTKLSIWHGSRLRLVSIFTDPDKFQIKYKQHTTQMQDGVCRVWEFLDEHTSVYFYQILIVFSWDVLDYIHITILNIWAQGIQMYRKTSQNKVKDL